MPQISKNLAATRQQIQELASLARLPAPQLLAVSKNFSTEVITSAYHAGQRAFGESYIQELVSKASLLQELAIEWHFIGTIQSNKTKTIAECASWVHALSKLSHAKRLNQQRPPALPPLKVLLQIKISPESSKQGLNSFGEILALANQVRLLPNLELCGLMGMASNGCAPQQIKAEFKQLASYQQQLNQQGFMLDQLSMGMSDDFPLAIPYGATLLRIGSKIFGKRNYAE